MSVIIIAAGAVSIFTRRAMTVVRTAPHRDDRELVAKRALDVVAASR